MKLRLTCTSLLPEHNMAWRTLATRGALHFGEYGDWPEALRETAGEDALAWVLLLEDIAPLEAFGKSNPEPIVALVVEALRARLMRAQAPTIVAWLGWRMESPIRRARQRPWHDALAEALSQALWELAGSFGQLYLIALDGLFALEGMARCMDARNFYATRCRFSLTGLKSLARGVESVLERVHQSARKVLVLDCDNTLWGGVVGEVGVGGLTLGQDGPGQAFVAFQRVARALAQSGTLLAISSKNEERDVWAVFEGHAAMVLTRAEITAHRIDWRDKTLHLQELAQDLDLGLESIVFWDDNPIEREKVRAALPMVLVPEPPLELVAWPEALASLDALARFVTLEEDAQKTQQYRVRAAFVGAVRSAQSAEAFLLTIAMRPRAVRIEASTLGRAAQLCAKTNQFNLRVVRHDEQAIQEVLAQPRSVGLLLALEDQFGDHGITGLAMARPSAHHEVAFLDTFLMSCRILGRHAEAWMLAQLRRELLDQGYAYLAAEYRRTERNTPAQGFLSEHGLLPLAQMPEAAVLAPAFEACCLDAPASSERYGVALEAWRIPHLELFP